MTPDKATALREAAKRVTPGPWEVKVFEERPPHEESYVTTLGAGCSVIASGLDPEDAAYIALADPPTILSLLAERERLRAFALAYRRKMEVGIAGMTDEEIQTLRLAWDYATAALEATDDQ